jgi:hypothetical protein
LKVNFCIKSIKLVKREKYKFKTKISKLLEILIKSRELKINTLDFQNNDDVKTKSKYLEMKISRENVILLSNKVINKLEINSILFMKIKIDIFIDEI